jgi:hypothetical protein
VAGVFVRQSTGRSVSVKTSFDTAYRTRAPFARCWAGFVAAPSVKVAVLPAVPSAAVKASHQSRRLMIGTNANVWPLSPEDGSTG